MIHTIKKAITVLSLAVFGSALLYNCEPDADTLGEQLFLDGAAQGKEEILNVTAFNIDNNDSIRSDASKLGLGVLGAFNEGQFGMQRASYLTQLRLSTYDPDFGANADVDSVVLVIKPTYANDSVKTSTVDDNYTYTTAADGAVNAKKVVNTYPVLKFGKAKKTLTIKVNEVTEFLKGASDTVKSNQAFAYDATVLGSKEFKGDISSVTITKDDGGAALFTASTPGIRISLDKTFFKDKIIAKKDQPELADASNFIRHFKGLRISVAEDDGYLFQFSPNDMELVMYYKYDKTENGTTTRPQTTYSFVLGSANTHVGQYEYSRVGSAWENAIIGDTNNAAPKLFLQGMGGPSIGIKIPEVEINKLKKLYNDDKAAIISAKIRLYTDPSWNSNYAKPTGTDLAFFQRSRKSNPTPNHEISLNYTQDLLTFGAIGGFRTYNAFDLDKNPAYYDFVVTKSLKDIVEGKTIISPEDEKYRYLRIDMGGFLSNAEGQLLGPSNTARSFATKRAVFVGFDASNPNNPNRVQLKVIYGTKK
jgi:hypothetical protein